jgi:hypothetical protein
MKITSVIRKLAIIALAALGVVCSSDVRAERSERRLQADETVRGNLTAILAVGFRGWWHPYACWGEHLLELGAPSRLYFVSQVRWEFFMGFNQRRINSGELSWDSARPNQLCTS